MVQVTKYRKIYYSISAFFVLLSLIAIFTFGLNLGIDFKGGAILKGKFTEEALPIDALKQSLKELNVGDYVVQYAQSNTVLIKLEDTKEETRRVIVNLLNKKAQELSENNKFIQESYSSVGPSIGSELIKKSIYALILVLIVIVIFIAIAFKKVSYPVSSWKYGFAALVALFHDVIIPVGVFAALGKFYDIEITSAFIAAILTILGYSVNDTIVVFDRIRENLSRKVGDDFEDTVNISVNQTFTRSINTSLTVLIVLFAIYFFGGDSIKYFALALAIGIFAGTYSSIFIGGNLLVSMEKLKKS